MGLETGSQWCQKALFESCPLRTGLVQKRQMVGHGYFCLHRGIRRRRVRRSLGNLLEKKNSTDGCRTETTNEDVKDTQEIEEASFQTPKRRRNAVESAGGKGKKQKVTIITPKKNEDQTNGDDEKALQKEAAKLKSEWLKNHSNAQELLKQIINNAKYHHLNNEQNGGQLGKAVEHVKKKLSQWQSELLVYDPKTMKASAPHLWISRLKGFLKLKRRIQKVGKQHQCCMKIKASNFGRRRRLGMLRKAV